MITFLLTTFLVLSLVLNGILIWYIRQLIQRTWNLSDNMDEVFDLLKEYNTHIKTIYGMETYHGDTVIENLLKHSKGVSETLQMYIEAREIVRIPDEQEPDEQEPDERE